MNTTYPCVALTIFFFETGKCNPLSLFKTCGEMYITPHGPFKVHCSAEQPSPPSTPGLASSRKTETVPIQHVAVALCVCRPGGHLGMKTEARAGNRQGSSQRARSHSQKPCLELERHRDLDEGSLSTSYSSWTRHWQAAPPGSVARNSDGQAFSKTYGAQIGNQMRFPGLGDT